MSLNYINMLKGGSNDIAYTILGTISLIIAVIIGLIGSKDFLKICTGKYEVKENQ